MTPVNKPIKQSKKQPVALTLDKLIHVRGGLITEVGFPAADANAKDVAY
jgi:hypothetical protein